MKLVLVSLLAAMASMGSVSAQPAPAADPPARTAADTAKIADALASSLVRVEITPQYDKGESPGDDRWAAWRAFAAQAADEDSGGGGWESWEQLLREERPAERGGFLIAPNRVFTSDPGLHPRFIKSIQVRFGEQTVAAKPVAWPKVGDGMVLELEKPLAGTTALSFDPARPGPYFGVTYEKHDAAWVTRIGGLRSGVAVASDGRRVVPGSNGVVVVDKGGAPVAIPVNGDLPIDGSWKKAIADVPMVNDAEMAAAITRLEERSALHVLRVSLHFRSPRNAAEAARGRSRYGGDEEVDVSEWNGLGVAVDSTTVLVLANLKPKITGRLERIQVFNSAGEETKATFEGALKDWGAFVARAEKPLPGSATWSSTPVTDERDRLLLRAAITVRGETRTAYFSHDRIDSFATGWKGQVFPQVDSGGNGSGGGSSRSGAGGAEYSTFLYELDGSLISIPLEHRENVTVQRRFAAPGGEPALMAPASLVQQLVRDRGKAIDAENRPLSEDEENRLAWLGVELQGIDPDLARANNVMDETNGGASGGIVTFVYPNSPATEAGLKEGDLILRLHVEGHPKPLEVSVEDNSAYGGMMEQFWANLDRVPEEYFDRLPRPWGNAETALTRSLTDLGFGTPFTADVWRDGKMITLPMKITQGPPHYDAASRDKSETLGLTVRDLTYEVRRYFQMTDDEPGVIISKVERGSKASVAGLKPYETIRTINDQPVRGVKEFEKIAAQGGELKMAVKRMTKGRTVKIKADAPSDGKPSAETAAPTPDKP